MSFYGCCLQSCITILKVTKKNRQKKNTNSILTSTTWTLKYYLHFLQYISPKTTLNKVDKIQIFLQQLLLQLESIKDIICSCYHHNPWKPTEHACFSLISNTQLFVVKVLFKTKALCKSNSIRVFPIHTSHKSISNTKTDIINDVHLQTKKRKGNYHLNYFSISINEQICLTKPQYPK